MLRAAEMTEKPTKRHFRTPFKFIPFILATQTETRHHLAVRGVKNHDNEKPNCGKIVTVLEKDQISKMQSTVLLPAFGRKI